MAILKTKAALHYYSHCFGMKSHLLLGVSGCSGVIDSLVESSNIHIPKWQGIKRDNVEIAFFATKRNHESCRARK